MVFDKSLANVWGAPFLLYLSVMPYECLKIILFLSINTWYFISSKSKETFLYIAIYP